MKIAALSAVFAATTLAACSTLSTNFDYDTSYDFAGLHTYAWIEKQSRSIEMKRVRDAVDTELRERGFVLTNSHPDFQVAAHISTQDRLRVVDWGYTCQPGGSWFGNRSVDVLEYSEGTLILDVVDSEWSELVWRGTASKPIDRSLTPEQRDEEARAAVQALLAQFPPHKDR